jgi:hypothetical protein
MKNPLRQLFHEICIVIFRCPYWQKCPYYDREECASAWIMRNCGKYKKYELEDGEKAAKQHEAILNERRAKNKCQKTTKTG